MTAGALIYLLLHTEMCGRVGDASVLVGKNVHYVPFNTWLNSEEDVTIESVYQVNNATPHYKCNGG